MSRAAPLLASLVVAACALGRAPAARAEWLADAGAGFVWEDNLSRAAKARDAKSDLAFVPTVSLGQSFQLTGSTSLRASADLRGSVYTEFNKLDNLSAGLAAGVRHKLGWGAFAPWVRAGGSAAWLQYEDDVLDSSLLAAGLEAGKRLHERIDLQAGYLYESRDANAPPFDQRAHTASVRGSFSFTGATDLVLGYATRWGDFTVHRRAAGAPRPHPSRLVETFDRPMFAFRIDATTYAASATVSHALSRHSSLNAGYDYQFTQGPRLSYTNNVFRASFTYSY